jgi:hypothetical protein
VHIPSWDERRAMVGVASAAPASLSAALADGAATNKNKNDDVDDDEGDDNDDDDDDDLHDEDAMVRLSKALAAYDKAAEDPVLKVRLDRIRAAPIPVIKQLLRIKGQRVSGSKGELVNRAATVLATITDNDLQAAMVPALPPPRQAYKRPQWWGSGDGDDDDHDENGAPGARAQKTLKSAYARKQTARAAALTTAWSAAFFA